MIVLPRSQHKRAALRNPSNVRHTMSRSSDDLMLTASLPSPLIVAFVIDVLPGKHQ